MREAPSDDAADAPVDAAEGASFFRRFAKHGKVRHFVNLNSSAGALDDVLARDVVVASTKVGTVLDGLSHQSAETWEMRRVAPKCEKKGGEELWERIKDDEAHDRPEATPPA